MTPVNTDLHDFLVSRRARLTPERAGVAASVGTRRVPGLRREEVASLAGISADYYTRLEQGRPGNASPAVLEAVAGALQLTRSERDHLVLLARAPRRRGSGDAPPPGLLPELAGVLGTLDHTAAFVVGRRWEVLAANALCRELLTDFDVLPPAHRTIAHFIFGHPAARQRLVDWEPVAAAMAAALRRRVGAHPQDQHLRALVTTLSEHEDFRGRWAEHRVSPVELTGLRVHHPAVGRFRLSWRTLQVPGDDSDQLIVVGVVPPGTADAQALARLRQHVRTRTGHEQVGPHPRAGRPASAAVWDIGAPFAAM